MSVRALFRREVARGIPVVQPNRHRRYRGPSSFRSGILLLLSARERRDATTDGGLLAIGAGSFRLVVGLSPGEKPAGLACRGYSAACHRSCGEAQVDLHCRSYSCCISSVEKTGLVVAHRLAIKKRNPSLLAIPQSLPRLSNPNSRANYHISI